jgi:hypothetical protein
MERGGTTVWAVGGEGETWRAAEPNKNGNKSGATCQTLNDRITVFKARRMGKNQPKNEQMLRIIHFGIVNP